MRAYLFIYTFSASVNSPLWLTVSTFCCPACRSPALSLPPHRRLFRSSVIRLIASSMSFLKSLISLSLKFGVPVAGDNPRRSDCENGLRSISGATFATKLSRMRWMIGGGSRVEGCCLEPTNAAIPSGRMLNWKATNKLWNSLYFFSNDARKFADFGFV